MKLLVGYRNIYAGLLVRNVDLCVFLPLDQVLLCMTTLKQYENKR